MWLCLLGFYLTLLLALTACAGFISLFVDDDKRRRQAFKVLRLLIGSSVSLIAAFAVHFYQGGTW